MPSAVLTVATGIAGAFLAGEWDPPLMTRRGQAAVGQRRVWVRDLALAARHEYPSAPRDRPRELATFLAYCPPLTKAFAAAHRRREPEPRVLRWFVAPTAMGEARWPVPRLDDVADLREMLGLSAGDLAWLSDTRQLEKTVGHERLRHYRYRWVAKSTGGVRLIEEPKPRLKHIRRVILREILDRLPVHPAAHGFCKGRSVLTYTAGHVGQSVLVHLDLEDFFASVTPGRVFGIFRQCGYPEPVAHVLTGLVTNSVPTSFSAGAPRPEVSELLTAHRRLLSRLAQPHLPQGAPTSPAIANLAALGLDRRLAGLAGSSDGSYSRYADDLAFSWPDRRSGEQLERFLTLVGRIIAEEGFRVNRLKTSVRRSGERQRLAGVVVNERPNIERDEYDLLKAILHNSERAGPASQNRGQHPRFRQHLAGRIAWVAELNPARGERLVAALERIDWTA
ncbi:MAG: reverse transcriptase family protein [Acidimicrobiales bacterium]